MKKTYHQPATFVVRLATSSIVATSFNEALGTTDTDGSAALVKEQSQSSYNVWDDDWSQ